MPNALEEAIADGLMSCFKDYFEMTGFWLSHAPEYFITSGLARRIFSDLDFNVYMDVSLKRIIKFRETLGHRRGPGKPPKYLSNRPDISVWYKAGNSLRAAIEIKKAYSLRPIKADVERLRRIVGKEYGPSVGYVVAYSEAKPRASSNRETLRDRFRAWSNETKSNLIFEEYGLEPDEDGWKHGWCVLRVDQSK